MQYLLFGFFLCTFFIVLVNGVVQELYPRLRKRINVNKTKKMRDLAYDEVLKKCKEATKRGDMKYLSVEDISNIIEEMK